MVVHIKGWDRRDMGEEGLAFDYTLWHDGSVWLVVDRSAELLYGYPAIEFRWDGDKIIAKDPKMGLQRRFSH
jgi:hypothetical protein